MQYKQAVLAATAALLFATVLHAADFVVKPGSPNQIVFTSKAATETFQGKTDKMQGRIAFDPAQFGDSVTVHLEVDMASLDTGIGKRNQHMRDNHLETGKYPKAIFDGATLQNPNGDALTVGKPLMFPVEGAFTLHGVTRRLRATVEVVLKDEKTLEFKTSFPVPLADYKISRPKFLFLKLGEVQEVSVSGVATRTP
jgi:polyisoprenoid-binding protein YceI